MKFTFFTLFPNIISAYFGDAILSRAVEKKLLEIECINFRDFAQNAYKKVDEPPIGGGAGQVIMLESMAHLLSNFCKNARLDSQNLDSETSQHCAKIRSLDSEKSPKPHIIFLTPCAKNFTQNDAIRLAKKPHIALVCGRYEGFDERLIELFADEVFSVGDFIMTGGELAALGIADSIARQIPGVLGNCESLNGESFENFLLEAPNFAKNSPIFEKKLQKKAKLSAVSAYSKGDHNKISRLKFRLAAAKTQFHRADLFSQLNLKDKK